MVIIPLRCAEPLPSKDDQWLDIDQKDKLGTINALPPRGCFFDSPSYLDDLVGRVRGVIGAPHMDPEATVQWAHEEADSEASKVARRESEEADKAVVVEAEIEAAVEKRVLTAEKARKTAAAQAEIAAGEERAAEERVPAMYVTRGMADLSVTSAPRTHDFDLFISHITKDNSHKVCSARLKVAQTSRRAQLCLCGYLGSGSHRAYT